MAGKSIKENREDRKEDGEEQEGGPGRVVRMAGKSRKDGREE